MNEKNHIIIAIDGPSASGKGTLAKKLANYFDLPYLNTGALYRFVAYKMIIEDIKLEDFEKNISLLLKDIDQESLENNELFTEKTGVRASIIAKNLKLRQELFKFQRDFVKNSSNNSGGVVIEGRDTTTVICPEANYKFFVKADVEIRAKRRFEQLQKNDKDLNYQEILEQLKKRDENDFNRKNSPLKKAKDAIEIDNGTLSIEEGFNLLLKYIKNN